MNLIVFCVFGDSVKYILGLYDNIIAARTIYPGWKIRVYVPSNSYLTTKINERFPEVEVIAKPPEPGRIGSMWRIESAWDTNFDHVIFRDADSIVTEREASLVREWIDSGESMHLIYDHDHHTVPVMAGMWGCRPKDLTFAEPLYHKWHGLGIGLSQQFLAAHVYPYVQSVFTHTSTASNRAAKGRVKSIEPVEDFIGRPRTPNILQWIDRFYVLNPDRYPERYRKFQKQVDTSEILSSMECIRVRGCTHDEEPTPYWANHNVPHYWLANQDHKRMLKDALVRRDDLTLIFEDDAAFVDDFDEQLRRFLVESDHCVFSGRKFDPWCALMLGGSRPPYSNFEPLTNAVQRSVGTYGMHAVLYNYAGLHGFYGHAMYWNHENIDVAFAGFQRENRRVYAPIHWLAEQAGPQVGTDC